MCSGSWNSSALSKVFVLRWCGADRNLIVPEVREAARVSLESFAPVTLTTVESGTFQAYGAVEQRLPSLPLSDHFQHIKNYSKIRVFDLNSLDILTEAPMKVIKSPILRSLFS